MKARNSIFPMLLIASALVSCHTEEPSEQAKELKQKALELATYLTDNYQVGESIFFYTEKNEIEEFVVKQNYFTTLNVIIEPDDEESREKDDFNTEIDGYKMSTVLQSKENTILVELYHLIERNKVHTEGSIVINGRFDPQHDYTNIYDDTIIIVIGEKKCTLTKNIGITNISDNKHIWKLAPPDHS